MKTSILFIYTFFLCFQLAYGQVETVALLGSLEPTLYNYSILKGRVVDKSTSKALEYSTVTLYSQADDKVAGGGLTDHNGNFQIKTYLKEVYLKIGFLGHHPITLDSISIPTHQKVLDLGTIELDIKVNVLENIEVRAERSSITMSLDKRIFNVGKDLVSEGGTAEDILRNVPSVWVDINGEVSLRSKGGVRVLLDGQNSFLLNGENHNGLRQIQASSIEKIEIITNPSARYNAEGMAGIINIVLKKNQSKGLNGTVHSNVGSPNNFGLGLNMNYRKNKFNFYTGTGAWSILRPGEGSFKNEFYHPTHKDSTVFSNMNRTHDRVGNPVHFRLGSDYYLNDQHTLSGSFSLRGSTDHNTSNITYKDALGSVDKVYLISERIEDEAAKEFTINSFLRHTWLFKEKEHSLVTNLVYENNLEDEESFFEEHYFDGDYTALTNLEFEQVARSKTTNEQLVFQTDYILPYGEQGLFETGFQSSFRNIRDDYGVSHIVDQVESLDSNFTNDFKYTERINSTYANFGNKYNRLSFQFGLRLEYSDVSIGQSSGNQVNNKKYLNAFPSAFLGYDLPNDNAFQLSYSRRIERPTFWDLNPFFSLRDRRNIWRGNPNIRPEYTNAFELGYIKYWDKGTLSGIAYFRKTSDVIKRLQRVDANFPESTITQTENLALKRNWGIEGAYSMRLKKWLRINGDMNVYHSLSEGSYLYDGEEVFVGGASFSFRTKMTARFTFWDKLNAQFTYFYKAPRTTTQGIDKATSALDFATSIDIFNNNASITLSCHDLFNTRRRRSYSEDDTFYSQDNFLWQSRSFILSFHYRINQHKKQSQIYSSPINETDEEKF